MFIESPKSITTKLLMNCLGEHFGSRTSMFSSFASTCAMPAAWIASQNTRNAATHWTSASFLTLSL